MTIVYVLCGMATLEGGIVILLGRSCWKKSRKRSVALMLIGLVPIILCVAILLMIPRVMSS
ncbi:MAG: hypothetical protein WC497_05300 [Patescibacteria group bacterium]